LTTVAGKPRLVSLREAAWRLDVHEETLRRLVRAGRVPAVRFGSRGWLKFDARVIDAIVEGRREA
jgi:excisionase family DNA binding protein